MLNFKEIKQKLLDMDCYPQYKKTDRVWKDEEDLILVKNWKMTPSMLRKKFFQYGNGYHTISDIRRRMKRLGLLGQSYIDINFRNLIELGN